MKFLQYKKGIFYMLSVILIAGICGLEAQNIILDSMIECSGFPKDYKSGVMYASIKRGGVIENIYAGKSDIEALQKEN